MTSIEIPLGNQELLFSFPEAEAEMIRSVLDGKDYPMTDVRMESDTPVIIDVGSNCGAAAIHFRTHLPGARIICYEPSASTFELLAKNVGSVEGIETHRYGIWDREGSFQLHHAPNAHSGAATLRPSDNWPSGLSGEEITTRKLSAELTRLGLTEVHILKVDAETAEAEILRDVLTNAPEIPIHNIYVEYHGIAMRKYLTEELAPRYDDHLCNVSSDRQGTLLFVLRKTSP